MIRTNITQHLMKYNVVYTVAIFFFIFQPPIFSLNPLDVIGFFSLAILAFQSIKEKKIVIHNEMIPVLVLMALIIIVCLLFTVGVNGASIYIVLGPIRFMLEIVPFGVLLSKYINSRGLKTSDYVNMCFIASGIQVALGLIALFVPRVHQLFADLLYARGYGEIVYSLVKNRIFGLADGLMYATPVLLSVLGMLLMITERRKLLGLSAGALFILAGIINARISIVVSLIGVIVLILVKGKSRKQKLLFICAIAIALLIILNVLMPIVAEKYPLTYQWIISGFEELRLFSQGTRTGYFNYFSDVSHFAVPSSLVQLMFGVGQRPMTGLVNFGSTVQSDIGYINDIWFGGLIYIFLLYGMTYYMLLKLFRSKNDMIHVTAVFLMVLFPVINIKGIAFSINQLTLFVYLLFIIYIREEEMYE